MQPDRKQIADTIRKHMGPEHPAAEDTLNKYGFEWHEVYGGPPLPGRAPKGEGGIEAPPPAPAERNALLYEQGAHPADAAASSVSPAWNHALAPDGRQTALGSIGLEGRHGSFAVKPNVVDRDGTYKTTQGGAYYPTRDHRVSQHESIDPSKPSGWFSDQPIQEGQAKSENARHEGKHRGLALMGRDAEYGPALKELMSRYAPHGNKGGDFSDRVMRDVIGMGTTAQQHDLIENMGHTTNESPYPNPFIPDMGSQDYGPDFMKLAAQEPEFLRNVDGKWQFHNPSGREISRKELAAGIEYLAGRFKVNQRPGGPR